MAGSASNWFKPGAGPRKGQAVYLSQAQQAYITGPAGRISRDWILMALNRAPGTSPNKAVDRAHEVADTERPAAAPLARPRTAEREILPIPQTWGARTPAQATARIGDARQALTDLPQLRSAFRIARQVTQQTSDPIQAARTLVRQGGARGDALLAEIQRRQGFDGLPTVVRRGELNALMDAGLVGPALHRGAGSAAAARAFQSGTLFSAGVNGRAIGAGTYVAGGPDADAIARDYANGGHLRMALRADARVADATVLLNDQRQWVGQERARIARDSQAGVLSAREAADQRRVVDLIGSDRGYFAAMLGYDAIRDPRPFVSPGGVGEQLVILNRTSVVVQQELE